MTSDLADKKVDETCYAYVDAEMAQFEEVAGTCSNKDNPDEPCLTVRSVTLGLIFVIGMSAFHQWWNFQSTTPFISSVLVIVLAYPLGHLWTLVVPKSNPFTLKEHAFIVVMANVAYMYQSVFIYATLTTLRVLERENLSFAYYFFNKTASNFFRYKSIVSSEAHMYPSDNFERNLRGGI